MYPPLNRPFTAKLKLERSSTDTNSAAALLGAPTTEAAPLAAEAGPAEVASASLEPVAAKEAGKEPA